MFVDVGANVGLFTTLGARLVRSGGEVWAYEVDDRNLTYLSANVAANYVGDWTVIRPVGAWSSNETLVIDPRGEFRGDTRLVEQGSGARITAVTLHEDLPERHIRLVKIDVEGAEGHVVHGLMPRLLVPDVDFLVLEALPHLLGEEQNRRLQTLLGTLLALGARFYLPLGNAGLLRRTSPRTVLTGSGAAHLVCRLSKRG